MNVRILLVLALLAGAVPTRAAAPSGDGLFARSNLVAWCIVPFDAKKRGPEERAGLVAAAAYLDGKLRELRESHRGGTLDRIAVLAGLNIAHELLEARQTRSTTDSNLAQHLQVLKMKLDAGLPSSLQ